MMLFARVVRVVGTHHAGLESQSIEMRDDAPQEEADARDVHTIDNPMESEEDAEEDAQ